MKKIVILGPESTGKSMLCQLLAKHYNTVWCAEYAREFLLKNNIRYNFQDLLTIAKGQKKLEDETVEILLSNSELNKKLLFIDTDQYILKVWCEYVFNDCHSWILDQAAMSRYDLYLLCYPDLPWIKDELREYPDEAIRQQLYHTYKDILVNQHVKWLEVKGNYDERLAMAIDAVNSHFVTNKFCNNI